MATAVSRTQVQPTRSWFQEHSPATLANPVPYTNYGGQGNPNAPTPTEQAGLANAAKNRAAVAAGVAPGPSIAVTNNRGTGVPIVKPSAGSGPSPLLAAAMGMPTPRNPGISKTWLDWIAQTYGKSSSRGAGFADLPAGVSLQQALARFNKETGSKATYIGGPSGDRVDFGNGAIDALTAGGQLWYDYGVNDGTGGKGVQGGASGGGGGGSLANPSGAGGGGAGKAGDFTVKPWDQKFIAPTQQEAQNDQGFQFTLARGKEALERSAAARGTLLTTGTLKDLDQFSQDAGSQQYDKVYGRRMGEYQTKYDEFTGNESARFGAHQANFSNNLSRDQFGLNVNQNQFYQGLATNQNAFNQQFSLANLGYRAASDTGQNAGNYADAAGNLYTQQGNAGAAGQVGSQNAWNTGIGSLANLGQYYAGLYQNGRQPQSSPNRGNSLPGQLYY